MLRTLTALLIAVAGAGEAMAEGLYKVGAGPHEVAIARDVKLHDAVRDQDVPLRVTYPKGDGPFPVVVSALAAGRMDALTNGGARVSAR